MKFAITSMLSILIMVCGHSQGLEPAPAIKTLTAYSFKDTTGIDLNDSLQISKYILTKKSYDKAGRLIQDIEFPFPHNPSYRTTRITSYEYKGDTTFTTILAGYEPDQLASETITIRYPGKGQFSKTINYASLNSPSFRKLDEKLIVITEHDSIDNLIKVTQLKGLGSRFDTIRSYERPLQMNMEAPSRSTMQIDSAAFQNVKTYGYVKTIDGAVARVSFTREEQTGENTQSEQRLSIDAETNRIRKTEMARENGLITRIVEYEFARERWQTLTKETYAYNAFGHLLLKTRDSYSEGVFNYRFYTYYEYEY